MTKASVNFKSVTDSNHAVSHSSREQPPAYLLPEKESLGTICIIDDKGDVQKTLEHKLSIASRQAKAEKNFSPVWEGVINLPRPDLNNPEFNAKEYKDHCTSITEKWIEKYQEATGHKVLRADIHLDEGRIDDSGEVLLNAHAHVIADRTNELGRVIKLNREQLRNLQTVTAEVTGLERGQSSIETGLKHLSPQSYKALAKNKELLIQKEIQPYKEKIAELKAAYDLERQALKDSGTAKQKDYQELKANFEKQSKELQQKEEITSIALDGYKELIEQRNSLVNERDALATELEFANYNVDRKNQEIKVLKTENSELQTKVENFAKVASKKKKKKAAGVKPELITPTEATQNEREAELASIKGVLAKHGLIAEKTVNPKNKYTGEIIASTKNWLIQEQPDRSFIAHDKNKYPFLKAADFEPGTNIQVRYVRQTVLEFSEQEQDQKREREQDQGMGF